MFNIIIFLCLLLPVRGYGSLCVKQNKSCSTQLWSDSSDDDRCQMVYYTLNSEECCLKEFKLRGSFTDFGSVQLESFRDGAPVPRTNFHVTARSIRWNHLKMRFKARQSGLKCMCRDFHIASDESIASDKVLFYDCPWSDASYEGKVVDFEFEYGSGQDTVGKKYTFTVPRHERLYAHNTPVDLTDLTLFTYVEQSASRNLVLKIQLPPQEAQVRHLLVEVLRTRNNVTSRVDIRGVSTAGAHSNEIDFVYNTFGEHGAYIFEVRIDDPSCDTQECLVTRTPAIIIPKTSSVLTVGIVGVVSLIPVIFVVLFIWRRQCVKLDMAYRLNQSVLLVSFPPNDSHASVASLLAQLLKHTLKFTVMLDIVDVPKTESKDPFQWFTAAFHNATHVVFLMSQKHLTSTKIVYKDIDNLALYLLKAELANKSCAKQFSLVTFPYSCPDIPLELRNMKSFKLMDDFDDFLGHLRRKQFCLRLEESVDILGAEMHSDLKDAIKLVEKNMDFRYETQQWQNYGFVGGKEKRYVLPDELEFKDKPDKRNKCDFLYDVNDMDLTGNKGVEACRLQDGKRNCFDVNDLDL